MNAAAKRESPRKRCRRLVKRAETPNTPLLIPLVHTVAAQIEGISLQSFLTDPTKLSKCLLALQQSLELDAILCFVDAASQAEALGAQLDWDTYPPAITAKPAGKVPEQTSDQLQAHLRIQTGVEVLKRLGTTVTDDVLFAVTVTGPATLADQIGGTASLEHCGRIISETVRLFTEAGAQVIVILEDVFPVDNDEEWLAALATVINVTRFYNALPVLLPVDFTGEEMQQVCALVPATILTCMEDTLVSGNMVGQILKGPPDEWASSAGSVSLITTTGELSFDSDIPALREACQRIRNETGLLS